MDVFERLSPFMRRARITEVGRDRLLQVRNQLQFVLVSNDISDNSFHEVLAEFSCPVYKFFSMSDIEKYFGYRGTKILGFRRHPLSNEAQAALKPWLCRAVAKLPENPTVAVLGASGIGRHHANWWNMEGANVVAFLGSNDESVAKTQEVLKTMFGFDGRGYTDLQKLLEEEKPTIVDVCLPPRMHYEAAMAALGAGCHVLCEKPFVFDDELTSADMLSHAAAITRLAERKGLMLSVSLQYTMAIKECLKLWKDKHGDEPIERYGANLVSPTRNRPPVPEWTWVDLAPHLLGMSQVLSKGGELLRDSIKREFTGHLAVADYICRRPDNTELSCHVRTFHTDVEPWNVRQVQLNDELYDIGGCRDENGVFQLEIKTSDGAFIRPDTMRLLIRSYLHGKLEVPMRMACQNMEWLLATLEWK